MTLARWSRQGSLPARASINKLLKRSYRGALFDKFSDDQYNLRRAEIDLYVASVARAFSFPVDCPEGDPPGSTSNANGPNAARITRFNSSSRSVLSQITFVKNSASLLSWKFLRKHSTNGYATPTL